MIEISDLCIAYGDTTVVEGFNLSINDGEFFTLLGPSGCGKTTVLRTIAGFVAAKSGTIRIDGQDVTRQSAEVRDVGIVFQNYALFPHMTVFDNVAFGLQVAKKDKNTIRQQINAMLESVGILDHAHKKPEALSGGQQQRVAIARSLIMGTRVLLFDEPLSNLDAKIRESMRGEIKRLQRELGFTAIFVTHDQEEALALSDRLVIMESGQIHQVGTGTDLYQHPASSFVCQFVGDAIALPAEFISSVIPELKSEVDSQDFYIRPEDICLSPNDSDVTATAVVEDIDFLGVLTRVSLKSETTPLVSVLRSDRIDHTLTRGASVTVGFSASALHKYPSRS